MTIQHVYSTSSEGTVVAVDDTGLRSTGTYPGEGPFADAVAAWVEAGGAIVAPPPPPVDLKAYAASARYAREIAGITVAGAEVDTSEDSQNRIANAWALLQASGAPSISYKAVSGFVTLTADQFRTLALAVGAHVQACFAAEAHIDAAIAAGTVTTAAQIDAAFAAVTA